MRTYERRERIEVVVRRERNVQRCATQGASVERWCGREIRYIYIREVYIDGGVQQQNESMRVRDRIVQCYKNPPYMQKRQAPSAANMRYENSREERQVRGKRVVLDEIAGR